MFKYKSCFMLGQAIFKMFDTPINSSFIALFVSKSIFRPTLPILSYVWELHIILHNKWLLSHVAFTHAYTLLRMQRFKHHHHRIKSQSMIHFYHFYVSIIEFYLIETDSHQTIRSKLYCLAFNLNWSYYWKFIQ